MKGGFAPEFVRVLKDPCGLTAISIFSTCPILRVIAVMTDDKFIAIIKALYNGRHLMRKKP